MRLSKYLYIFIFSVLCFNVKAQFDMDKYLKEYDTVDVDQKIALFFYFFTKLEYTDADTILYYIKDLHQKGSDNNRQDALAMSHYGLSYYLEINSLYNEAHVNLNKAIQFYESIGNDTLLAETYNGKGRLAFLEGRITESNEFYKKSYKHGALSGDKRFQMLSTLNLARNYIHESNYEKAEKNILNYIEFHKQPGGSTFMLASAYGLLGEMYLMQEDIVNAKKYFKKNADLGFKIGSFNTLANAYTNLAISEFYSGNYETSEDYFRFALGYRIKHKNYFKIAESYYNLGDYYSGMEIFDSAIVNYEKSINIAGNISALGIKKDAMLQLSGLYEVLNRQNEQIEVLKKVISVQNEISSRHSLKETNALTVNFEQSVYELLDSGDKREKQLEKQVHDIQSAFNDWLIIGATCILGLFALAYYLLKRKKI